MLQSASFVRTLMVTLLLYPVFLPVHVRALRSPGLEEGQLGSQGQAPVEWTSTDAEDALQSVLLQEHGEKDRQNFRGMGTLHSRSTEADNKLRKHRLQDRIEDHRVSHERVAFELRPKASADVLQVVQHGDGQQHSEERAMFELSPMSYDDLSEQDGKNQLSSEHRASDDTFEYEDALEYEQDQEGSDGRAALELSLKDHNYACNATIITNIFSTRKDWQHKVYIEPRMGYFSSFFKSVLAIPGGGVRTIVLHDSLPDELVKHYAPADGSVKFVKVDLAGYSSDLGVNDVRWMTFRKELEHACTSDAVFVTDIHDVTVKHNPCTLLHDKPGSLYVGSEPRGNNRFRNKWAGKRFKDLGGKYLEWFDGLKNRNMDPFYNAGVIGGTCDQMLKFAASMEEILTDPELAVRKSTNEVNVNMAALNYILHNKYDSQQIVTDYPVHSRFRGHEKRDDIYITHK